MDRIQSSNDTVLTQAFDRLTSTVFMLRVAVHPGTVLQTVFLAFFSLFSKLTKHSLIRQEGRLSSTPTRSAQPSDSRPLTDGLCIRVQEVALLSAGPLTHGLQVYSNVVNPDSQ